MDLQSLEKMGMTKNEIKLYLKLLEFGSAGASTLAKNIGENRTSTYSLLNAMLNKGFVSYLNKEGIKYFSATDPKILVHQFLEDAGHLKALLPELLAISNQYSQKPKITFYEGLNGIKQIAEMFLEHPGSTRYSFMGSNKKEMNPEMLQYIEEDFLNRRIALGIKYKGIVAGSMPMATKHAKTDKAHLREVKYIQDEKLPLKIHVDIFAENKVAIYSYNKGEMMGVVIEHESFYTTMRTVFELAWRGI